MRPSTNAERRKTQRRSIFLEGTISFAGRCRLKCMVQNLSKSGAKLAFHTVTDVPRDFTLNVFLAGKELQYLARPRWRRGRLIGAKFVLPPRANAVSLQDYIKT
jgi:PilZ domain-containing protein